MLSVISYDEPEELADRASDTEYCLAAVIWWRDIATANHLARQIRADTVWINILDARGEAWDGMQSSGDGLGVRPEAPRRFSVGPPVDGLAAYVDTLHRVVDQVIDTGLLLWSVPEHGIPVPVRRQPGGSGDPRRRCQSRIERVVRPVDPRLRAHAALRPVCEVCRRRDASRSHPDWPAKVKEIAIMIIF
ncbi:aldehyde dehydrogenase family protein [Sciscionella marina]|uniref:aldehyde dehydrogenase family protein n=1 Tax=Sciscionella marina TaxID=508770 RepID=UPI00196A1AE3|nr:aldehyde dehydrogenase family protein [Sciscionella marina]